MAKPGYMQAKADRAGVSIERLVIDAYNEAGSLSGAAKKLGVTRNAVRHYLTAYGYKPVTTIEEQRELIRLEPQS